MHTVCRTVAIGLREKRVLDAGYHADGHYRGDRDRSGETIDSCGNCACDAGTIAHDNTIARAIANTAPGAHDQHDPTT